MAESLHPLHDALPDLAMTADDILAATVFTTSDPVAELDALRSWMLGDELDEDVDAAVDEIAIEDGRFRLSDHEELLRRAGAVMLNQTPLIRGINKCYIANHGPAKHRQNRTTATLSPVFWNSATIRRRKSRVCSGRRPSSTISIVIRN